MIAKRLTQAHFNPKWLTSLIGLSLLGASTSHASLPIISGDLALTIGGFSAHQGKTQDIGIQGLIGDRYTVSKSHDESVLFGAGIFKTINDTFAYGLNVFYLSKTNAEGLIFQEHLFDNLGYQYGVTHIPILATLKATKALSNGNKSVVFDVGIGPNILQTKSYNEFSRDFGVTIPNNAFVKKTQTEFAASAGIGILCNELVKDRPIEIAYRFFYLGKGEFGVNNNQVLNTLQTGNTYAHAITLTATV
jgi:hypothetical protein